MAAENYQQALDRVAAECGVEPEFWDIFGKQHVASIKTKQAIVSALGFAAESAQTLLAGIAKREEQIWTRLVGPCQVIGESQQPARIPVHLPDNCWKDPISLELKLENGSVERFTVQATGASESEATLSEGRHYIRKSIELPIPLPLGYHDLQVTTGCLEPSSIRLIICPDCAYLPAFLADGGKTGGIAISLYGARSERNWGCGDFRDLRRICEWAAREVGVSFVALNPLHAIHNRQPYNTSPYLPNSIFYQNFIYLDVESIEEFQSCPAVRNLWQESGTQREISELRAAETVQYERVSDWKIRFLRLTFEQFRAENNRDRSEEFSAYIEHEGDLLYRYATYCALDHHLHAANPKLWTWREWPAGYSGPESAETRVFQKEHGDDILFYQWMQWQIDRQLAEAQEHAVACGLAIGLYHDLALATDRFGSDLWAHRPYYVDGCRVGSPPDDFSPQGQDWAFPPPNKNHHRARAYRLFVESIRNTCRHGGALRIDHVMRFFRLYWIPDGSDATSGAYVRDNWEDLIRILALESVRNKVLVVGEDLGTVEPEVREALGKFGILSYRLFYFERDADGQYKSAAQYPRQALVSSTTHDLPTIAGFWTNEDIKARKRAGLLDDAGYYAQESDRLREKQKMLDALWAAGLLPEYVPRDAAQVRELTGELHNAIIGFLALTPSMLMVVNQEDLSKDVQQQNLPGSTWQHPNWSRKMKFTLEQLGSDPAVSGFVSMFRNWLERTGRSQPAFLAGAAGQGAER